MPLNAILKMEDTLKIRSIALIIVFLAAIGLHAADMNRPVRINGMAIQELFQSPLDEQLYGKEFAAIHQSLMREVVASIFNAEQLAEVLNSAGVPREKLLKINTVNFIATEDFTLNVDMKTRELWVTPGAFFSPMSLAEEINWAIGFMDYQDSPNKASLNNKLDRYVADNINLEVNRVWLVDDLYQELDQKKLSGKAFKYHLKNYLNSRKSELEFNRKELTGWKYLFPPEMISKWVKHNLDRLDKINALLHKYINSNTHTMLETADVEFLRGDIISKSFSDCSFCSNSFDNIISIYQEKNYALLYSLAFGHYYSLKTIASGFICPGYNQFRKDWRPVFDTGKANRGKITAADFILTFDKSPPVEEKIYLLFSVNVMD